MTTESHSEKPNLEKKRNRGRPKLEDPRRIQIKLRLNREEYSRLEKSIPAGVKISDFIRVETLNIPPVTSRSDPPDLLNLHRQLVRIGNNINQISRAINAYGGMQHAGFQVVLLDSLISEFSGTIWKDYQKLRSLFQTSYDRKAQKLIIADEEIKSLERDHKQEEPSRKETPK